MLVNSIVCLADDSARAVPNAADEILREESLIQATADVLNARLKLEDWKLGRLHVLRESGFATWREVTRQQLMVDMLSKQRDTLQELAAFTRALQQRALLASETRDTLAWRERTVPPIKLSIPGSVRLVGWIEQSETPLTIAASSARSVEPTQQLADELKAATENLFRAEKRCSGLSSSGSASEHWQQNAELQLALAQAELQLVRMKQIFLADSRTQLVNVEAQARDSWPDDQTANDQTYFVSDQVTSAVRETRFPVGEINAITTGSHRGLSEATLKVAKAEAEATGELRAAEIALQRVKLRSQALQNLQAEGFADRVDAELGAARQTVAKAVLATERLRRQQVNLKHAYLTIKASWESSDPGELVVDENSPAEAQSLDAINLPGAEAWPLSLLTDIEIVRHLIELRRTSCETSAQREALALKLAMLERCLARLESIAEKSDTKSPPPQRSIRKNDFKLNLQEGLRSEIDALQLDIRHCSAMRQAAEERLRILALEEMRFMQQCLAQQNAVDRSGQNSEADQFVSLDLADSLLPNNVALKSPRQAEFTGCSYLESRDFEARESALGLVFWQIANRDWALSDYPIGIRLLDASAGNSYCPSTQIGIGTSTGNHSRFPSSSCLPYDAARQELPSVRFNQPEQRDHLWRYSYERAYPFGILRSDLRSQQPVGFVPWYFPGSPANYPYPNRP